jgi:hypothetical protein
MVCPNKKSEDWQNLVKEHGEYKALSLFHLAKGDYEKIAEPQKLERYTKEYESTPEMGPVLKKVSEKRDRLIDGIQTQIDELKKGFVTGKRKNNKFIQKQIDSLEDSVKALLKSDFGPALEKFARKASKRIESINAKVDKVDPKVFTPKIDPVHDLFTYKNNLDVYRLLNGVIDALNEVSASEIINSDEVDANVNKIQITVNKVDSIQRKIDLKSKVALAKKVSKITGITRGKRKEELEKEFHKKPKIEGESRDDYHSRRTAWVQSKLTEESDALLNKQEDELLSLMENSPYDINVLEGWLNDQRSINDPFVQSVVTMMDQDDKNTDSQFMQLQADLTGVFEEWLNEGIGKERKQFLTNPMKLYEGFYEVDKEGKPTGYYTREYYSEVAVAYQNYVRDFNNAVTVDEEYSKAQGLANEKIPDIEKRKQLTKDFIEKYGNGSIPSNFKYNTPIAFDSKAINEKWKNPQWPTIKSDKLFRALNKFNASADKKLGTAQLGIQDIDGSSFLMKMPFIKKNFKESLASEGISNKYGDAKQFASNIVDRAKDLWKTSADDTEYGDTSNLDEDGRIRVSTDPFGRVKKRVPILFRATPDPKKQSFDLVGISLSNMYNSINYKNKSKRIADVEMIKDIVSKRDVTKTRGGKALLHRLKDVSGFSDQEIADVEMRIKGYDSNVYKTLESIIDDRLYGEGSVAQVVGNVNMNKVASNFSALAAHSMLSLNWLGSGLNNALQGEVSNFIMAGNRTFFGHRDMRIAHKKYRQMWPDMMKNMGSFHSTSKLDQLRHKFLPESIDFNGLQNDFLKNSKIKRLVGDIGGTQVFSKMGESIVQGTLTLAMMNNMKIQNHNGKFINAEGKVVDNRSEAATLDELYQYNESKRVWELNTVVPNGLPNEFIKIEGMDFGGAIGSDLADKIEFKVRRKIQEAAKRSQGNYSDRNKAKSQRYAAGKLAGLMRRWLVPSVQRRLKGFGMSRDRRMYNEALGEFDEGSYVTTFHFVKGAFAQTGSLKDRITSSWNDMTVHERGLVIEATKDAAIITAGAIAGVALLALAEGAGSEGEEDFWYTLLYLTKRTQADLAIYSYGLPGEFNRTLKDPSVALRTLNDIQDILSPFSWIGEDSEYKTGDHKGDKKGWVKLNKTFNPIYKHFHQDYKPKEKWNYLKNI